MISGLIGIFFLIGAVSIAGLEYAMGPHQRRFPCVNKVTIWILRIYSLSLFGAAINRIYCYAEGHPIQVTVFQVNASFWLGLSHAVLYYAVLKSRLPDGVWPYLQVRVERARRAAKAGGDVGAILARAAVDPRNAPEAGMYQPPKGWSGVLQALLHRP